MKILKNILFFIFLLIIICILTVSFISLRRLIFRSDPLVKGEPVSVHAERFRERLIKDYNAEEVKFDTTDDLKLSGLLIRKKEARGNVLLCHGFQRTKEFMKLFMKNFDNYNIFMFDFRGHGQSDGYITTLGLSEACDVISAAKFFRNTVDLQKKLPFVILGLSMGGSASLRAAFLRPDLCDALILDSSFKDLDGAIDAAFTYHSGLPNFPFVFFIRLMAKYFYDCDVSKMKPIKLIENVKTPILFIHSSTDTIVPTEHSLELYSKSFISGNKAKIWIAPPVFHGTVERHYPNEYKKKVQSFLNKIL
ncbi:alpha/beta fold hydrolase [Candidatus Babeliales bacterium]|nr:alpha/beta fold hydrolase [Candidatus Babeliales bacterium]